MSHHPPAVDSILFDLDGTLWDSSESCAEAWDSVLKMIPDIPPVSASMISSVMGLIPSAVGETLLPCISEERRTSLLADCLAAEKKYLREHGGLLYAGVEGVLESLSRTYRLFIVSNCQDGYIEAFFDYHKLSDFFEDIECSGRSGTSKNENIKSLTRRNRCVSSVYVGDTGTDQSAAGCNSIPFIFARYGFGTADNPDYSIDSILDLPALLETL